MLLPTLSMLLFFFFFLIGTMTKGNHLSWSQKAWHKAQGYCHQRGTQAQFGTKQLVHAALRLSHGSKGTKTCPLSGGNLFMETLCEEPLPSRIHVSTVGLSKFHYPLKPPSGFCGI